MKRQEFANRLSQFTDRFSRFMFYVVAAFIIYLVIQLQAINTNLLRLARENQAKLDQVTSEYYPLVFDRHQNVLREPPIFHLDDSIVVESTFRNTDNRPVVFGGVVHWELISPANKLFPPGSEVLQFEFTDTVPPGCKELRFENRPPAKVVDLTRQLFKQAYTHVTWRLKGDNVIISPEAGASVSFEVEQFTYIPDGELLPKSKIKHDNTTCKDLEG